MKLALLTGYEL